MNIQFCLEEGDAEPRSKVRLVVPNSSCGGIIGKGGATIKYENFLVFFFSLLMYPPMHFIFPTCLVTCNLQHNNRNK